MEKKNTKVDEQTVYLLPKMEDGIPIQPLTAFE